MNSKEFKERLNSISFKLVILICFMFCPLVILTIHNNFQTREALSEQVNGIHKNMLQSYQLQIDIQLKNSMTSALEMVLFESDTISLSSSTDESTIAFAKAEVYNTLSHQLLTNNLIDALYVESKGHYIAAVQANVPTKELDKVKQFVATYLTGEPLTNVSPKSVWVFTQLDSKDALINITYGSNGIIAGAYVRMDRLISNFKTTNSKLLILPTDSVDEKRSLLPPDNLLITTPSSITTIQLAEVIPKSEIFNFLPFVQRYFLQFSISLAFLLPVFLWLMKRLVIDPLQRITKAMRQIRKGNMAYRIPINRASNEFQIVNHTFNEMMDEVKDLKISMYEEQIKLQKSQLRNLQMQIKPHFLINSLNMIQNLIDNEKLASAKQMIFFSVRYFRYMTKADENFVVLNDEIMHISNYLEIQKIRYKERFTYNIDINKLIEDMLIPPLLIQNFVENSIKYAIEMSKLLHISITVEYLEMDYYPYAKITVSDTGVGYPPGILSQLNAGEKIAGLMGDHIGIFNSVQRIKVLYGQNASWRFYNQQGANAELIIPAWFENQ